MSENKQTSKVLQIVLPVLLLVLAAGGMVWFIKTRPAPRKQKAKEMASVVETIAVTNGRNQVTLTAMGTVTPVTEIALQPEVSGLIVWKNPNLAPGGILHEGESLLRIDARNYEAALLAQEANLEKALVNYQLELSRSEVAAEEWQLLNISTQPNARTKALALREPQLRAAQAEMLAASNALARAKLDVDRTNIKSPFNAVVLAEFVDRGQLVSPQTTLAKLAGTDMFRVEASLPVWELEWMQWPNEDGDDGPPATLIYPLGDGSELRFDGQVVRVLAGLGEVGRMATVLIETRDPLQLSAKDAQRKKQRLFDGAYVQVLIDGLWMDDVFDVPGAVVREGNIVWVMNTENRLEFREVDVAWRQNGRALLRGGLAPGDNVVSSSIPVPIPDMKLRVRNEN